MAPSRRLNDPSGADAAQRHGHEEIVLLPDVEDSFAVPHLDTLEQSNGFVPTALVIEELQCHSFPHIARADGMAHRF
jgi:hypothetical protein